MHTGGAWIAEWLQKKMGYEGKSASLNINFYRDDFSRAGVNPKVEPTEMPVSIDDKHIILVDDVFFTGRTVRSALDAIMTFGRPSSVEFLTLIERRFVQNIPIKADYIGKSIDTIKEEKVSVLWKEKHGKDQILLHSPILK